MYQIYPRSFHDSNGDGVGDLQGITGHLEYVADLGVDGVWISPFFRSPMKDFGYDVSDYRDIDPLFGTLKDFDHLVEKAHGLDLKIIVDLVMSHTSNTHSWFQESRLSRNNEKADWYVWADPSKDGTPPNNWRSVFGGEAWEFDTKRCQYYLHNFLKEQPDLNFHNPAVQQEMLEITRFWLEKGVDGFRLDAINFIMHDPELRDNPPADMSAIGAATQYEKPDPYSMQQHIYDKSRPEAFGFIEKLRSVMDEFEGSFALAEIGDMSVSLPMEYTNGPEKLHTAYSFGLMGQNKLNASKLREVVGPYLESDANCWPSWAFSNHDVVRTASRWADGVTDENKCGMVKTLIALLLSLRGTIFIYQGEELGLPDSEIPYDKIQDPWGKYLWPEWQGRDGCRTPMPWTNEYPNGGFTRPEVMPWLPVDRNHLDRSVKAQEAKPDSVLNFTRKIINWRKNCEALTTGDMKLFNTPFEDLVAFERCGNTEQYLCLFNLGENPLEMNEKEFGYEPGKFSLLGSDHAPQDSGETNSCLSLPDHLPTINQESVSLLPGSFLITRI